jgi:hypothetical protein
MARLGDIAARFGAATARWLGRLPNVPELDYVAASPGAIRIAISDASGNILGAGALLTAQNLSLTRPLDMIGVVSFEVPATDPLTQFLVVGNRVRIEHRDNGDLGEAIIRSIGTDAAGARLRVQCYRLLQELTYFNCLLRRKYDNVAVSATLSDVLIAGNLYGLLYGTGWTPGAIDGGLGNIVIDLHGETILEAIDAIRKRLGKHFREGAATRRLDFGAFGADNGYRIIHPDLIATELESNASIGIVADLQIEEQTESLVNKLIPLGAGTGLAQLTLEKCSLASPYTVQTGINPDGSTYWYLRDAASATAYGERTMPFVRNAIVPLSNSDADLQNAANALYTEAAAYLQLHKVPHKTYRASVARCPVGLREGDLVRLVYRGVVKVRGADYKWIDENALYWVMDRVDNYNENGAVLTELVLSNTGRRAEGENDVIVGMMHDIQVGKTHVQPYPSAETYVYKEEIAASRNVTLPIEFDSRVLYLNSTKVRVQTRPLRSTVTSVSAGGGTTATSSSGGSSTPTTSSGGAQTPTASSDATATTPATVTSSNYMGHVHALTVFNGTSGATVYLDTDNKLKSANGLRNINTFVEDVAHDHTVPGSSHSHNHSHTVTISAHTHTVTIGNHTHTVTLTDHTHTMQYGIYDDTAYPTTISLSIDGTDRTGALGGPWAGGGGALNVELDVTTYLVNAAGGLRIPHTLVFSCTGGQGQIVATIRSLMTTQAIAVA